MGAEGVRISVRGLIEYSLRGGSIDFEYRSANSVLRAREGAVFHRRLQKRRELEARLGGFTYEREVSFCKTFEAYGIDITVRGRADGIWKRDGKVFVEEIKTTEMPLDAVTESEQHIAQAKCYAWFYALENEAPRVYVLLSYLNIKNSDIREFEYCFAYEELKRFFEDVMDRYAKWARFIIQCRRDRNRTAETLAFPYDSYRKRQREMCVLVYRAVERKRPVFISAPTGVGKTVSALFPAIKAFPSGKTDRIFYLTAKTITRTVALEAVSLMAQKGLWAKTLVITAKDKACFMEKAVCEAGGCVYANGHFDRVNDALHDILLNENIISRETVSRYAEKHTVCPYEFSLDIALYSDIIICDYNYAFDPRVYLRRFFAETSEKYVFLIDEAHNLVDRAREMYSAEISSQALKVAAKGFGRGGRGLRRLIKDVRDGLREISENITGEDYGLTLDKPPSLILSQMRDFCRDADAWLSENKAGERGAAYEQILDIYFNFNHFLSIWDIYDEDYVCYCERERGDIRLKLFCVNPAARMESTLQNAVSAVFFSATLTPFDYFKRLLGAKETDYAVALPSPFPEENLAVLAMTGVSARYKDRERYYGDVADYILAVVTVKPGNYFAFFPSYAYLESVYGVFTEKYPQIETSKQTQDMPETEKELFLERFIEQDEYPFVCFAVMGGMFSEGVDLPGLRLIGAFIISVGLPKISFERLLISNYFGDEGFEYAYMYPGMNKVLQAGGRLIRTMSDKGVLVLIDERFSYKAYSSLFPAGWSRFKILRGKDNLSAAVTDFWHNFKLT